MSLVSKIEWTEATWNPVTGCSKISIGCEHCYAERLAKRLKAMGNPRYKRGFEITVHEDLIDLPLKWNKPKIIFVNSMSDLFHEDIPNDIILRIFNTMLLASKHCFQILTKRSNRLLEISKRLPWSRNIWMGVTVESTEQYYRIEHLKKTEALIKFLSLEPLLGPFPKLNLEGINWVIVGGESGPGARPMKKKWVLDIRDLCLKHNVPFFFKQWGGVNKKKAGRILEGRIWEDMPPLHL
ncbi:MAG: phage Gp37/Gp68 family protein [Desulfovibrionaceae bacterium]|nr:phage Gp37/Gp68 family protein [Desulfovibrionaceae bacterium]